MDDAVTKLLEPDIRQDQLGIQAVIRNNSCKERTFLSRSEPGQIYWIYQVNPD